MAKNDSPKLHPDVEFAIEEYGDASYVVGSNDGERCFVAEDHNNRLVALENLRAVILRVYSQKG